MKIGWQNFWWSLAINPLIAATLVGSVMVIMGWRRHPDDWWLHALGWAGGAAIFVALVTLVAEWPRRPWQKPWEIQECPKCGYPLHATGGREIGCPECGWNRPEEEE